MNILDRDWAESVEINGVSDDGRTGFTARLARFPGQGRAWLWAFALMPGPLFGYNDDELPLAGFPGLTDMEADGAVYELPGAATARFERRGPRAAMVEARLLVEVPAHRANHPRNGPGAAPVRIEATFRPAHAPHTRGRGTRT